MEIPGAATNVGATAIASPLPPDPNCTRLLRPPTNAALGFHDTTIIARNGRRVEWVMGALLLVFHRNHAPNACK
jgi:hypothetical protein